MNSGYSTDFQLRLPKLEAVIERDVRKKTRQGIKAKARYIADRLLSPAFFLLRPHRRPTNRYALVRRPGWEKTLFASSFHVIELKSALGGSHSKYHRYLSPYFDFPLGPIGHSRKLTKPYLLNQQTERLLTEHWRDASEGEVWSGLASRRLTIDDLPSNGVLASSFSSIHLPAYLLFDRAVLDERISTIEEAGGFVGENLFVGKRRGNVLALRWLYAVRKWLTVFGGVPNLYRDYRNADTPHHGNGRLYGVGPIHIQTLTRPARTELYRGSGWWDYDFIACHPSIIHSLGTLVNVETPYVSDYLSNREAKHEQLANDWDIPIRKVKTVINGMCYGQPLSTSPFASIRESIGRESVIRLQNDPYYLGMRNEVRKVARASIAHHTEGDRVTNAVGKSCGLVDETGNPIKSSTLLSHILTGYEAWAVQEVCKLRDDLLVLMHDGWVSRNQIGIPSAEKLLREESKVRLGFILDMRIKGEIM